MKKNFHEKYKPFFANIFSANSRTLMLLKSCFTSDENEIWGMELNDGKIDIDMNLNIDEYSKNHTVYAINQNINEDEPLFLISDNIFLIMNSN
ncbi:MAG: hypothetical protein IPM38_15125 [Ignavibacteria bacterium]|nr:hypothetical protein [Ignavibacteria bacterium]